MRSLSSRENRSQPRSPRWVCSTTVGTSDVADIPVISRHRVFSGADSQATSAARENRQSLPSLRPGSLPDSASSITRRLLDLEELGGLLDVHHLRRVVGMERVRSQRLRRLAEVDASACASTASPARSAPGGCRGRRTSTPGPRPGPSCACPAPRRRGAASRRRSRAGARTARSRRRFLARHIERYLEISCESRRAPHPNPLPAPRGEGARCRSPSPSASLSRLRERVGGEGQPCEPRRAR